ncbi:hypothetical protein JCM10450v2_008184 [Rhodotorula kratochvilovae]
MRTKDGGAVGTAGRTAGGPRDVDSPDKSSYIPVSLSDTLTQPKRTYTSSRAAAGPSSSSSSARPRPSHAHSASLSRERGELARRDAQAMMEALGMGTPGPAARTSAADVEETPRPGRVVRSTSAVAEGAAELAALRAQLGDKDAEIATLRREKRELAARVEALEREARAAGAKKEGAAAAAAAAALDARQLEELERQFEAQETLLSGYQREAERSAGELEKMRRQQRRLTDFLERTYGPSWADDLGLSDRAGGGVATASPAVRTKLVARASLMHTPSAGLGSLTRSGTLAGMAIPESPEQDDADDATGDASLASAGESSSAQSPAAGITQTQGPPPALLAQHLDSVQTLLRAMEARLIARDAELAAAEQRARDEGAKLHERGAELEELVERQRREVTA